jgi:hypothetical protein
VGAEGDAMVVRPGDVEVVEIGERSRIAIGGSVEQQELIVGLQMLAVPLEVAHDHPTHVQDGRDSANELLGCGRGQQLGTFVLDASLLRVQGEIADHRSDDSARGLRATVEEEDGLVE